MGLRSRPEQAEGLVEEGLVEEGEKEEHLPLRPRAAHAAPARGSGTQGTVKTARDGWWKSWQQLPQLLLPNYCVSPNADPPFSSPCCRKSWPGTEMEAIAARAAATAFSEQWCAVLKTPVKLCPANGLLVKHNSQAAAINQTSLDHTCTLQKVQEKGGSHQWHLRGTKSFISLQFSIASAANWSPLLV